MVRTRNEYKVAHLQGSLFIIFDRAKSDSRSGYIFIMITVKFNRYIKSLRFGFCKNLNRAGKSNSSTFGGTIKATFNIPFRCYKNKLTIMLISFLKFSVIVVPF